MARKKRKKIASRGSVNDIILKTLVNGDKYGYEIIKEVEEYSEGKIQLKQPSLYSSLSRFEEKGYVSSYWGDSDIGGRRHYYHLTDKGKIYFEEKNLNKYSSSLRPATSNHFNSLNFKSTPSSEELDDNIDSETLEGNDNNIFQDEEENYNESNINQSTSNNDLDIEYEEVEEDDIPAVVNFEDNEDEKEIVVPDHVFHTETPIEKKLDEVDNSKNVDNNFTMSNYQSSPLDNNQIHSNSLVTENSNNANISKEDNVDSISSNVWKDLANRVNRNNKKVRNSNCKILRFKQKKTQIVILDKDGIYKLRDSDYSPTESIKSNKIIDNVGKRIENKNMPYINYTSNSSIKNSTSNRELTEEERKIRNENFLAKFNLLTKSKMKPVVEKKVEEKPKVEIDYRKKLDAFIDNSEDTSNIEEEKTPENNLFNYVDEEDDNKTNISNNIDNRTNYIEEDDDDKFINFEPVEFETKSDDKKYIDEISNFSSSQNDIKFSRYENKSNAILSNKSYVLINKVKCLFGIILFALMTLEVSISLVIFKNNNLIFDNDKVIFIIAYILSILIPLIFILPILFNPNEHKINNFKLKYSIIFGILTFLVSVILIYCINSLVGFEIDNFKYFAVKLLLPIILTFNFVIMPPIYAGLIKCKRFYD